MVKKVFIIVIVHNSLKIIEGHDIVGQVNFVLQKAWIGQTIPEWLAKPEVVMVPELAMLSMSTTIAPSNVTDW